MFIAKSIYKKIRLHKQRCKHRIKYLKPINKECLSETFCYSDRHCAQFYKTG
ncbi:hypothetical protein HMPREF9370_0835 [Neisseria wadsworthii 9715]|uniref:Uncharacterized protein n=1 Tax=Neisseria wadsworthii 9715 TaxID=1030841 RepID=G4CP26_9NEIS|nr:hypothetical protein HMPREF9370_0835 [Neisseria wadsworthii 9715]